MFIKYVLECVLQRNKNILQFTTCVLSQRVKIDFFFFLHFLKINGLANIFLKLIAEMFVEKWCAVEIKRCLMVSEITSHDRCIITFLNKILSTINTIDKHLSYHSDQLKIWYAHSKIVPLFPEPRKCWSLITIIVFSSNRKVLVIISFLFIFAKTTIDGITWTQRELVFRETFFATSSTCCKIIYNIPPKNSYSYSNRI